MNNDHLPAWNMGKVLTINCESSLGGLMYNLVMRDDVAPFAKEGVW